MYAGSLPYALPLLITAGLMGGTALYAFRRREQPEARLFGWLMLAMAEWAASDALVFLAPALGSKLLALRFSYLGVAAAPPLWFAFATYYTGYLHWLTRRNQRLLAVPSLLVVALAFTNEAHHLIWRGVELGTGGFPGIVISEHGVGFWAFAAIGYSLVLVGVALYLLTFLRAPRPFRRQAGIMVIGALLPLLGSLLYLSGGVPLRGFNPTPFTFAFSSLVVGYGVFRFGLLDLTPIAASLVLKNLGEAVIVVDRRSRILSLNPTAQNWFGVGEEVIGRGAHSLPGLAEALQRLQEGAEVRAELEIGEGAQRRLLELALAPLRDARGRPLGQAILGRDITRERTLLDAEQRRARQMELLNAITHTVLQIADLRQMLQALADRLGEIFEADGAYLTLWDEREQKVIPVAAYGEARETYASTQPQPGEQTLTESVLRAGRPLAIEDVFHTPYLSPRIAALFPTQSALALPLISAGKKLGAALIAFDRPHRFTPQEIALGEQVAAQISLALAKIRLLEELESRAIEAETLRQATAAVVGALRLEEAIERVLVQLERVVPYDSASVQLLARDERGRQYLEIMGGRGWPDPSVVLGIRFPVPGDNPNTVVIQERRTHILGDAPSVHATFHEELHCHIRSWLGVPLIVGREVIGMLSIERTRPHFYTEDHARLVGAFADQVALAIRNSQLYQAEQDRTRRLAALYALSLALADTFDEREVCRKAVQTLHRELKYDHSGIFLVDAETGERVACATRGWENAPADWRIPPGQGLSERPLLDGKLHYTPDVRREARYVAGLGSGAEVDVPLRVGNEIIGVLVAESKEPHAFGEEDFETLTAAAGQIALALGRARLFQAEEQGRRTLSALLEVLQVASSSLEFKQVLKEVAQRTAVICKVDRCSIFLLDEREERLLPVMSQFADGRVDAKMWQVFRNATADRVDAVPLFRQAVRERRPAQLDDPKRTDLLPRRWTEPFAIQKLLVVPLLHRERVLGVLALDHMQAGRTFTPEQVELAQAIGTQVSSAIANARLHAATQARAAEQAVLLQVSTAISAHLELPQLLTEIARQTTQALDGTSCYVSIWEPEQEVMRVVAEYYGAEANPSECFSDLGASYPLNAGDREYLQAGQPFVTHLNDAESDPTFVAHLQTYGGRTALTVPLLVGGELFGELELWDSRAKRDFSAEELRLAQTISNQAALAIQNARLYEAQRVQLRLAHTLQEVGALLTAELSLGEVLERLFDLLARVVDYDRVSVYLLQEGGDIELMAARGFADLELVRSDARRFYHLAPKGAAWADQQVLVIPDTRSDPRWLVSPGSEQIRSWVGAPLLVRGKRIGTLNVDSHTPNAYSEQTGELVMAFANQAAIAIQNALLSDRLQELARTDPLTGLANRRHLFEEAQREFERARRYGRPLAVLMFDLDHFKRVNDTHGHAVGDEVLRAVAQRCRRNLREIDILGRYGGEEFLAVLPEAELKSGQQAAERLRRCVGEAPVKTEAGPVRVTISLGVASLEKEHTTLQTLVKAADLALYAAKERGRNRVVVAG